MTYKNIMSALVLSLLSLNGLAQFNLPENNVWVMGTKTGLDFNANPPAVLTSNIASANEGSASVADSNGSLLFYSNGSNVWNASHTLMPNGANINGSGTATASTTQGTLIIPHPGASGKYFLFSQTAVSNCRLFSNLVDMSLNGGMGDVDQTYPLKGLMLNNGLTEKMVAVPACLNTVWVVVFKQNQNAFLSYRINELGLDTTPVVSTISDLIGVNFAQGVLKASSDGTRLLACNFKGNLSHVAQGVSVFDFDGVTGQVSNHIVLDSISAYGGSFSPDGQKVYAQQTSSLGSVYQYSLTESAAGINKTFLGNSGQYADLKLAPDGAIYFGSAIQSPGFNGYRYMGKIHYPNLAGLACTFQDTISSIPFLNANGNAGALTQGLPNEIVKPLSGLALTSRMALDTVICDVDNFSSHTFKPLISGLAYVWNNGTQNDSLTILQAGIYWVKYQYNCQTIIDTFRLEMANPTNVLIHRTDTSLWVSNGYQTYQWFKDGNLLLNATNSQIAIQGNGWYSVEVSTAGDCVFRDSFLVSNNTSLPLDAQVEQRFNIYPNPFNSSFKILFRDKDKFTRYYLYNLSGKLLSTAEISTIDVEIDAQDLSSGGYVIMIENIEGKRVYQMIYKKINR